MIPPRATRGFTLLELLIVVVIIGVLAAVGTPLVTGYIQDGRQKAAENGLRAIYLMQKDYLREEGVYYNAGSGDQTAKINTELFSGNATLDETGKYKFSITAVGRDTFRAVAVADGQTTVCINNKNKTQKDGLSCN